MVGLVVVSHSQRAADGIVEVASEMAGDAPLVAVGGEDGGFGTDANDIAAAIRDADDGDGVVLLVDLGSAVMNAELAIELAEDVDAVVADAPVLEGTVNAAVAATSPSATRDSVHEQAEAAAGVSKL